MWHASYTLEYLTQLRNAVNLQKEKKPLNYVEKKTAETAATHVDVTPPGRANWATSFVVVGVVVVTTLSCKWHVVTEIMRSNNNNAEVFSVFATDVLSFAHCATTCFRALCRAIK